MYLARHHIRGKVHYFIKESYLDPEFRCYRSRELFDLGADPSAYIVYPGGNSFYIDDLVSDIIGSYSIKSVDDKLEEIFWPFVKPALKRVMEQFGHGRRNIVSHPVTAVEREEIKHQLHIFDQRRLYYLRYGSVDQSRIGRAPMKLWRVLLGKSRDELEQYFEQQEKVLPVEEIKEYVYVIFDLQRFFSETVARIMPEGLNQVAVDDYFVKEFCRLDLDPVFWLGLNRQAAVPFYLLRYLFMFFDHDYGPSGHYDQYLNNFINNRRFYQPPPPAQRMKSEEVSGIFGEKIEVLRKMSKNELTRLYRQKAHELHPDKGGDPEQFVRLTDAYREMLQKK
ncbi:MAG: hypothetical protein KKB30_00145 [Proteobacteria bacterium]|nr:hypothetical protein [Pseudomonadota bacterium]MBU1716565.1 hypothetical protein [Pseudomonadota bacterium]